MDATKQPCSPCDRTVLEDGRAIEWYDATGLTLAGKWWPGESRPYERFPIRAEGSIPEKPWRQSLACGGLSCRFETDASLLYARWLDYDGRWAVDQLGPNRLALYVRQAGGWTWLGTAKQIGEGPVLTLVNDALDAGHREYLLYLPYGRGMSRLELGVPPGATLAAGAMPPGPPLVFYGTSITQGGSASRPGNTYVSMIERHVDCAVVNLGLSGSGCMELEVVRLVAEVPASVFVLDCLPNMVEATVSVRVEPAVRLLRNAHPDAPIVLVDGVWYQDAFLVTSRRERCANSNRAQREAFDRLVTSGVRGLHYVPAEDLLGADNDATVDGTHPNDLGHRRIADRLIRVLAPLLSARAPGSAATASPPAPAAR